MIRIPELTFIALVLVAAIILTTFIYNSVTVPGNVMMIYGAK